MASNKDMVDNLVKDRHIKSLEIERAFRVVDRANYFPPGHEINAYNGAFKIGNIHISTPGIYAMVMDHLKLSPGLSFLNIGSGTGYLSTMVGILIGPLGANHGVEIHDDVIEYAHQKLKEFKKKVSVPSLNIPGFSEPAFVKGNGLCLPRGSIRYDRLYCGAECPGNFEGYMKNLINVGGVLVMPLRDQLLQITRISETQWQQKIICGVRFSVLQLPTEIDQRTPIRLPDPSIPQNATVVRCEKCPATFTQWEFLRRHLEIIHCDDKGPSVSTSHLFQEQNRGASNISTISSENSSEQQKPQTSPSEVSLSQSDSGLVSSSFSNENEVTKNELLENLKKVTERLQELTECPVCFGFLDSALVQCKFGHGICSSCASRMEKCPSCKEEFVVHQSTLLSKILDCLPKLCVFVDKGCSVIVLDNDHEAFCKFRPSVCRSTLCDWSGCVKDLIGHVKTCGKVKPCEISSEAKELQYFKIDKIENMFFYVPLIFQNQLFWEYFHRDVATKRISYRFCHVATAKPTSSYYFKVSFKKGKIEYTHSYKAFLDAENDKAGCGDETGLIFPDSELERFRSSKECDEYEYSIEVITDDIV